MPIISEISSISENTNKTLNVVVSKPRDPEKLT